MEIIPRDHVAITQQKELITLIWLPAATKPWKVFNFPDFNF